MNTRSARNCSVLVRARKFVDDASIYFVFYGSCAVMDVVASLRTKTNNECCSQSESETINGSCSQSERGKQTTDVVARLRVKQTTDEK